MIDNNTPLLLIKLEGQSIGEGRISVSYLLHFLENFSKALIRSGEVLFGEGESKRRGPKSKRIKDELDLELTLLTHGSPATILGFDRRGQISLSEMDKGFEIIETMLKGLHQVQDPKAVIPPEIDSGILIAWRDLGELFDKGCDLITFTLNQRPNPLSVDYTRLGRECIQKRIREPEINIRTIEGRLLMIDFKEYDTRCRIHPSFGNPVICLFDEELKEAVLENFLKLVRIVGEANEDPISGKINSIKIRNINTIEEVEAGGKTLTIGEHVPFDFWKLYTLEELASIQDIQPVLDVTQLIGGWPGDTDDGFEEEIQKIRDTGTIGARYGRR